MTTTISPPKLCVLVQYTGWNLTPKAGKRRSQRDILRGFALLEL